MATLKVRGLNTKDFWAIISIIRKGGKEAITRMKNLPADADEMARGMLILDIGMEYAEKDLTALLADLAGMTLEEYEAAPFDTTLEIIEQITAKEDLANFFKRVSGLVSTFTKKKQA